MPGAGRTSSARAALVAVLALVLAPAADAGELTAYGPDRTPDTGQANFVADRQRNVWRASAGPARARAEALDALALSR